MVSVNCMTCKIGPDAARKVSAGTIMRRPAVPDEMVGPMFLASDAASYTTGQVFLVDGGLHPLCPP